MNSKQLFFALTLISTFFGTLNAGFPNARLEPRVTSLLIELEGLDAQVEGYQKTYRECTGQIAVGKHHIDIQECICDTLENLVETRKEQRAIVARILEMTKNTHLWNTPGTPRLRNKGLLLSKSIKIEDMVCTMNRAVLNGMCQSALVARMIATSRFPEDRGALEAALEQYYISASKVPRYKYMVKLDTPESEMAKMEQLLMEATITLTEAFVALRGTAAKIQFPGLVYQFNGQVSGAHPLIPSSFMWGGPTAPVFWNSDGKMKPYTLR